MPQSDQRPMSLQEWAMLLALAVLWGGSFFFNSVALREIPVLTVVLSRVALAALILLAVLRLRGERMPRDRRVWAAFFGMGLLNNAIPFSLIVWGQQHIASGVASILNAATPLFTVILAHMLTRDERMTRGKLASVLTGFAGVAVMIGVAAISTALAYVLYFRTLATAGATNLLLVTFLVPVSAILLGTLFLGEGLLSWHLAGMALIGAGLAAIDGRPWQVIRAATARRNETA